MHNHYIRYKVTIDIPRHHPTNKMHIEEYLWYCIQLQYIVLHNILYSRSLFVCDVYEAQHPSIVQEQLLD